MRKRQLLELFKAGVTDPKVLAEKLDRTPGSIEKKLERMGVVVVQKSKTQTTTSVPLSKGLLTHEQALKILAGALDSLRKHGLDKLELQRLRTIVDAIHTYDSVLEKVWKLIIELLIRSTLKIVSWRKPMSNLLFKALTYSAK